MIILGTSLYYTILYLCIYDLQFVVILTVQSMLLLAYLYFDSHTKKGYLSSSAIWQPEHNIGMCIDGGGFHDSCICTYYEQYTYFGYCLYIYYQLLK